MAATGAALVALALLGMFHLPVGGGADAVATGEGGGAIGFGVSALLTGAVGTAGAWVVLVLLVGRRPAALLQHDDRRPGGRLPRRAATIATSSRRTRRAAPQRRRPSRHGRTGAADAAAADRRAPGLIDRMRDRLAGGADVDEEPPVIVRRERPAPSANGGRAATSPSPIAARTSVVPARRRPAELEHTEEAHLAEAAADGWRRCRARAGRARLGAARPRAPGRCARVIGGTDGPHRQGPAHPRDAGALRHRREGRPHPGGAGRHPVRARRGAGHQAEPDRGAVRQPGAGAGGAQHPDRGADSRASRTSASRSRTPRSTW